MIGGQFDNPFDVGVQIRGILNDDHEAEMVYDGLIHNRTRVLHCSQVQNIKIYKAHLNYHLKFPIFTKYSTSSSKLPT